MPWRGTSRELVGEVNIGYQREAKMSQEREGGGGKSLTEALRATCTCYKKE